MRNWIKKLARPLARPSSLAVESAAESGPASVVEGLEERRLCSTTLTYGLNANAVNAGTYNNIVNVLKDTGTKSVRLWLSINSYSDRSNTVIKYIQKFHNDGFDTTVTVNPKYGQAGSYDSVKDYFNWLADSTGWAVDRWEIGNEIDHPMYWKGSLSSYVSQLLAPAYSALHANGEKVISAGVSWNPDDIKTLVGAGMLNYCDYVGYHPYRNSVAELERCVALAKQYAGGKQLVATEWNVRDASGTSDWANKIEDFWPTIRDNFYAAYYYAAIKSGTQAGASGLITSSGAKNGVFYDTYKDLQDNWASSDPVSVPDKSSTPGNSGGGSTGSNSDNNGSTGSTSKPTPSTGASTGSKPSGTVTVPAPKPQATKSDDAKDTSSSADGPDVLGFRVFDADTGEILYKNVSGDISLKLSALRGHTHLRIRALTDDDTASVDVGFSGQGHHVENAAPYNVFSNTPGGYWNARKGSFSLVATAFSQDNAKGNKGDSKSLTLNFV